MKQLLLPVLLSAAAYAHADVTLATDGRGWYDSAGYASRNNAYTTGIAGSTETRSWFRFDLSGITDTVTAATFRVYEPTQGFINQNAGAPFNTSETVTFRQASATGLAANGSGQHGDIFTDLGDGAVYGTVTVTAADGGRYITLALNADCITAINAARGSSFAFGAALTPGGDTVNTNRTVFAGSNTDHAFDGTTQLILTTQAVPEPGTYGAGAALVCAVPALLRRRRALTSRAWSRR